MSTSTGCITAVTCCSGIGWFLQEVGEVDAVDARYQEVDLILKSWQKVRRDVTEVEVFNLEELEEGHCQGRKWEGRKKPRHALSFIFNSCLPQNF